VWCYSFNNQGGNKVIKQIALFLICKIKSHNLVDAGSCPFTGKSYNACLRCGATITK
jgi:hypothetical protein